MRDCINPVSEFGDIQEAVCIGARKIMDACRDQTCVQGVPVYLTTESQSVLEAAASVKARSAELLAAEVAVEPVPYQDGYYTVSIQYFYRVIADAVTHGVKPVTIYGLAAASRQAVLYGGAGSASTFRSDGQPPLQQPVGVAESVDPMVLCASIADLTQETAPAVPFALAQLPEQVLEGFDDALVLEGMDHQLQVTLGLFSLVRLERETQLLIPSYDYCVPAKESTQGPGGVPENPCEAFSRMQFPVSEFFPTEEDVTICGDGGSEEPEANAGSSNPGPRPSLGPQRR